MIEQRVCAACKKMVLDLVRYNFNSASGRSEEDFRRVLYPKGIQRAPLPAEVPNPFATDYNEAVLVLTDSPKASAALSRRCLQSMIQNVLKIKKANLNQEIDEVIKLGRLSSDLLESIDAVRTIGNFAAHEIKSTSSGEIVEVEPHEADWNLDVLEMMFDELFVRPQTIQKKRAELNAKLTSAGKGTLKSAS